MFCDRAPPVTLLPEARYDEVMAAFGGKGYLVRTVEELRSALALSLSDWQSPSLLNVLIDPSSDRKQQVTRLWLVGLCGSPRCSKASLLLRMLRCSVNEGFLYSTWNAIRLYCTVTKFLCPLLEELLNSFIGQVKVIQISCFTHRFADLILTLIQPSSEMCVCPAV